MPDDTIVASIVAQWRPRIVVRATGTPLVIYDLDGITRITPMIVVPDEVWDGPDWASYRSDDSVSHRLDEDLPADPVPQWLESPSSRAMAALMNERMLVRAEAEAIAAAVGDAHVMLTESDLDAVDHLLDLIGETAISIVNTLNKPPPGDI